MFRSRLFSSVPMANAAEGTVPRIVQPRKDGQATGIMCGAAAMEVRRPSIDSPLSAEPPTRGSGQPYTISPPSSGRRLEITDPQECRVTPYNPRIVMQARNQATLPRRLTYLVLSLEDSRRTPIVFGFTPRIRESIE